MFLQIGKRCTLFSTLHQFFPTNNLSSSGRDQAQKICTDEISVWQDLFLELKWTLTQEEHDNNFEVFIKTELAWSG